MDNHSKVIISITTALVLAYVLSGWLRRWLLGNIQHGPDSNDIKKNVYHDANIGCYKMVPVAYICPFNRQRI
jgi:hypothetical protein